MIDWKEIRVWAPVIAGVVMMALGISLIRKYAGADPKRKATRSEAIELLKMLFVIAVAAAFCIYVWLTRH